ncbi:MAG TPA: thioredoxin [bacterium]|nr:thioredoxin [bacterium]
MSGSVIHVTDAGFDALIGNTDTPVLVDLWAPWCAPCRRIGPIIDDLAREYSGRVVIAKMNVDENKIVPARYRIRGIPTILMFREGKLQSTLVGLQTRSTLKDAIDDLQDVAE